MANERRLIDANALYIKLGKLAREPDYQHPDEDWGVGVAMAMSEVWEAPTVDVVEAVRCGQCKHAGVSMHTDCAYKCENKMSPCRGRITAADFGCTYGERR